MKIKMIVSMSGATTSFAPGDIVELNTDEAERLIKAGFAEIVRVERQETAIKPAQKPEKAILRDVE